MILELLGNFEVYLTSVGTSVIPLNLYGHAANLFYLPQASPVLQEAHKQ